MFYVNNNSQQPRFLRGFYAVFTQFLRGFYAVFTRFLRGFYAVFTRFLRAYVFYVNCNSRQRVFNAFLTRILRVLSNLALRRAASWVDPGSSNREDQELCCGVNLNPLK